MIAVSVFLEHSNLDVASMPFSRYSDYEVVYTYQGILSGNAVSVILKTLTRNSVSVHSLETLLAGVQSLHIF
jgi:hypothetical protein